MNLQNEIEKLLEKYPDPRKGMYGVYEFQQRKIREMVLPRYGVVSDNKDPLCLGRIRVACDMISPGAVTPWIPIVGSGRSHKSGFWQLPDIGVQCLLVFPFNCIGKPAVAGFIYDLKHRPPKHSTEKASDSVVYQTKNHRIELIDEAGKEAIIISTAKGKMRIVLSSAKGIEIINELGDIRIKCRKLKIEAGKELAISGNKKVSLISKGEFSIHSKNIKLNCDKEVKMKGKNIKLDASRGIATGGKQLAAEGNKVMGFDIHKMEIPAPKGTKTVPLPHPFIGKLKEKVSDNVKINGHNAATKGSIAKHDNPIHLQLPGTIKFTKNPKKEGEVTGGTTPKVKINGKEAATIGSTVTTCNDIGMKDNSTIIAPGSSIPMPVIINPKNMEEYAREQAEKDTLDPEFTTLKWSKSKGKEGEELELSAQIKDIDDGNMVTFQVWKEGQDPASHIAQAEIPASIESGIAKAKWMFAQSGLSTALTQKPKFFFTAHSAWCPMKKSNTVEISGSYELIVLNTSGEGYKDLKYVMTGPDGTKINGTIGNDGRIEEKDLIPGRYQITFSEDK